MTPSYIQCDGCNIPVWLPEWTKTDHEHYTFESNPELIIDSQGSLI